METIINDHPIDNFQSSTYTNIYHKNDIIELKNIAQYDGNNTAQDNNEFHTQDNNEVHICDEVHTYNEVTTNEGSNAFGKVKEASILLIAIFIPILIVIIFKFTMNKIKKKS
ncbi:hypothetical protein GBZ86_16710 [Clostridium tarantellae]|uniref:Uncharacterized protein n=2 Tax=Clostridium tarantellae TaxID=39493 RepID=A0A6I1MT95_9CLOT|nr:hypothetical protein [Clostridium tarantellae]